MNFQLLGKSGLRVSELALGTMTFGEDWGWGSGKDESRAIFDAFAEAGGNFIDTADGYTNGTSEQMLGEFLQGRRERFVVATKYTFSKRPGDPNSGGNHRKNMVQALEGSLKRLGLDYIDLYWVHAWDQLTPPEEMMRGLDDLVRAGKILYVGISDAPAWVVSYSNAVAELRGWTPFIALQIEYSLIERTSDRELIPMAKALGLSVTSWSPLASGLLTGKHSRGAKPTGEGRMEFVAERGFVDLSARAFDIVDAVKSVAAEIGRSPAQVALNWVVRKGAIPILGARKLAQLRDNLASIEFELTADQVARLDAVSAVSLGFPQEFLARKFVLEGVHAGTFDRIRRA